LAFFKSGKICKITVVSAAMASNPFSMALTKSILEGYGTQRANSTLPPVKL